MRSSEREWFQLLLAEALAKAGTHPRHRVYVEI